MAAMTAKDLDLEAAQGAAGLFTGDAHARDWCAPDYAERGEGLFAAFAMRAGPYALGAWSREPDGLWGVDATERAGRRVRLCFRVSGGLVDKVTLRPVPPEGVVIRRARPEDGPALTVLQRNCPMVLADGSELFVEPRPDYALRQSLAGELVTFVALYEGVPAGMTSATRTIVRYRYRVQPFLYEHQLRVLPEHRKRGLFWGLRWALFDAMHDAFTWTFGLIHEQNARSLQLGVDAPWSERVMRLDFACAPGGEDLGRPATPGDLPRLVALFNETHARSALFAPYTEETLHRRLTLQPDRYGYSDIRLSRHAAIGVWRGMDSEAAGQTGLVLDHACVGAAGSLELQRLLAGACADAAKRGASSLAVITSPSAPAFATLQAAGPIASAPYVLGAGLGERQGDIAHGIAVDAALIWLAALT